MATSDQRSEARSSHREATFHRRGLMVGQGPSVRKIGAKASRPLRRRSRSVSMREARRSSRTADRARNSACCSDQVRRMLLATNVAPARLPGRRPGSEPAGRRPREWLDCGQDATASGPPCPSSAAKPATSPGWSTTSPTTRRAWLTRWWCRLTGCRWRSRTSWIGRRPTSWPPSPPGWPA
jgi:hypothetical protein